MSALSGLCTFQRSAVDCLPQQFFDASCVLRTNERRITRRGHTDRKTSARSRPAFSKIRTTYYARVGCIDTQYVRTYLISTENPEPPLQLIRVEASLERVGLLLALPTPLKVARGRPFPSAEGRVWLVQRSALLRAGRGGDPKKQVLLNVVGVRRHGNKPTP